MCAYIHTYIYYMLIPVSARGRRASLPRIGITLNIYHLCDQVIHFVGVASAADQASIREVIG